MKERRAVGERGRAGRTGRMDGWTDRADGQMDGRAQGIPEAGAGSGKAAFVPPGAGGEQPASAARQLPSRPPLYYLFFEQSAAKSEGPCEARAAPAAVTRLPSHVAGPAVTGANWTSAI